METERRMVVVRDWGKGTVGCSCLIGTEFPVGDGEKVPERDGGDGYTTV